MIEPHLFIFAFQNYIYKYTQHRATGGCWVITTAVVKICHRHSPSLNTDLFFAVCSLFSLLLKYTWVKFTFLLECILMPQATLCSLISCWHLTLALSDRGCCQPAARGEWGASDWFHSVPDRCRTSRHFSRALLIGFAVSFFFLVPRLSQTSLECSPTPSCVYLLWNCKGSEMCFPYFDVHWR